MKASDFVARRLARWGLDTCFTVTGEAMHLNDSFGADPRRHVSAPRRPDAGRGTRVGALVVSRFDAVTTAAGGD